MKQLFTVNYTSPQTWQISTIAEKRTKSTELPSRAAVLITGDRRQLLMKERMNGGNAKVY